MPTVPRVGPYRFFFYSNEGTEPAHIHVQREQALAKFWLVPTSLARSTRFGAGELRRLERIVIDHHTTLIGAWNDYFGS